jgi:hypothetical protein
MDPFFRWIESTPLSVWTRESTSVLAFPAILSVHAIGMALAAGVNAAIASTCSAWDRAYLQGRCSASSESCGSGSG